MRVIAIIMIIFIMFLTFRKVDSANRNRYFLRNINRSINNSCNKKALLETNNNDVYNCIIHREKNCNELQNYAEYAIISENCMKIHREQFGAGILISVTMWIGIGIFSMVMSGV